MCPACFRGLLRAPFWGKGNRKLVDGGLNVLFGRFCDSESKTSEEKAALMDAVMRMAVPVSSGWKNLPPVLITW